MASPCNGHLFQADSRVMKSPMRSVEATIYTLLVIAGDLINSALILGSSKSSCFRHVVELATYYMDIHKSKENLWPINGGSSPYSQGLPVFIIVF